MPREQTRLALILMGTALAYAVAGWASLWLSIPPAFASPLFPAAGIALACVLTYGWRVLPAVALGSFAVNVALASHRGTSGLDSFLLPMAVALGATLQAAAGAWLVLRFVRKPLTLSEPRDVMLFCLISVLTAGLICSSIAVGAMHAIQGQPLKSLVLAWLIWGTGDTFGVLIAAPITLSLIGQPSTGWKSRRLTVGLTLSLATVLMAVSIRKVDHWEEARIQSAFDRDAGYVTANLEGQLRYPLYAVEALRSTLLAPDEVTAEEHRRAASGWLPPDKHLQALGWIDFRRPVSATDAGPSTSVQANIRYVEPLLKYKAWVGENLLLDSVAKPAIETAIRSGAPSAVTGFRSEGSSQTLGIFQAVYAGTPVTTQQRLDSVLGLVFVTFDIGKVLLNFESSPPSRLTLCLVALGPQASIHPLGGPAGCEEIAPSPQQLLERKIPLSFADQSWLLHLYTSRQDLPDARASSALLFSVISMVATTMLAALLLMVTGRASKIEAAVHERTMALQREITDRERTEAELRESEQRFRNILNNVPIGVVYTDLRGNIREVNPRFCELTGYSSSMLMGMNFSQIRHPEDRVFELEEARQLIRGEVPCYRRQGRYVTRDGRLVWVQSTVSLLRDPSGAPHRIVGAVEDITEHLRLADADRARLAAESANMAKSEFLSRMSHELRTPLNAMLGFAQLLELDQNHPLAQGQRAWMAQIQSAGWHLLDMINDVLDLSRIESGTLSLHVTALPLHEMVAATIALVEGDATRRGITITQDLPSQATQLMGDATRVKQILTNVLSNAVKYNSEGGRIHITSQLDPPDSLSIVVTDTGLGMTADQLAHLFQPFNRLGRERSSLEGTGIGLVVSQRLAELMGGSLTARSIAGQGSSFVLRLPRATDLARPDPDSSPLALGAPSYHRRKVHYVEDNATNVEVMRGVLSRRPQVLLSVSVTGRAALELIRSDPPDLILLDMHLPDVDGLELLRQLKSDPTTGHIPVVVVSADALASQIKAARAAGAQHYVTKPISIDELLSVVDTVLDQADTRYG